MHLGFCSLCMLDSWHLISSVKILLWSWGFLANMYKLESHHFWTETQPNPLMLVSNTISSFPPQKGPLVWSSVLSLGSVCVLFRGFSDYLPKLAHLKGNWVWPLHLLTILQPPGRADLLLLKSKLAGKLSQKSEVNGNGILSPLLTNFHMKSFLSPPPPFLPSPQYSVWKDSRSLYE